MSGLTNNTGFNFLGLTNLSTASLDSVTIGSATILDLDGTNFTNCTTTTTPVTGNAIVNKSYVDNNFMSLTEDNAYTGLLNDFAGTLITKTFSSTVGATFSGSCPSTAITPTLNSHLTRKLYVDNAITSAVADKASLMFPNTFDSSNTMNGITIFNATAYFNQVPECSGNPTIGNHLMRKSYGDNTYSKLSDNNTFYGINTFNSYCPFSNIEPTDPTNLTTKNYTDNQILLCSKLSNTQTFTGVNTFSGNIIANGASSFSGNVNVSGNIIVNGTSSFSGNVSLSGNVNVSGNAVYTGNTTITVPIYNPSLNILSSFRECGVVLYKAISGSGNYINFPIWKSITNLTNFTSQSSTSGALTTAQSGTVAGSYGSINTNDADALWLVSPNYGVIAYLNSGYTSTQLVNYKNLTNYPVIVVGSTASLTSSVRVYYNDVEQT